MLKLLAVVSLTLAAPVEALVSGAESSAASKARLVKDGGSRQALAPAELPVATDDVARAYDELRFVRGSRERAQVLAQMPSETRTRVWAHHLLTMLVKHPEFTAGQRAVIQEALSLLTPELFEVHPSNPRWVDVVDMPLRRLKERAVAAFSDSPVARDLFTQVGPDYEERNVNDRTAASADGTGHSTAGRARIVKTDSENCICSVASDWCYTGYQCLNAWCNFTGAGCGTLLLYPCEGLCFMKPH